VSSHIDLSKTQKAVLAWSAAFFILAELAKSLRVEADIATRIGLVEVLLAILTGIAFGFAASSKKG
jgi:hypothetical protein